MISEDEATTAAGRVALAAEAARAAATRLQESVDAARRFGLPWAELGRLLDPARPLPPTTARHRHGGGPEAVSTRREQARLRMAARATRAAA